MSAVISEDFLRFRAMGVIDLDAVMEIEHRAYDFPWTRGIFRDCIRVGYQCRLCYGLGSVLGYGIMSHVKGEAHILNLCVRPEFHGRGIGRALLSHLLEAGRERRVQAYFLEVRPTNQPAVHLYRSLGFNEVGMRKDYYPARGNAREDALVLARHEVLEPLPDPT